MYGAGVDSNLSTSAGTLVPTVTLLATPSYELQEGLVR